jgi:putative SOS response-associated peptidase YedK
MCSRYSLTSPPEAVRAYFGYQDTPNFPARYNIAPTQPIAVVARDREGVRRFRLMRWGLLPSFVKDPKEFPTLINARSEDVLSKPSFRNAMPSPARTASDRLCERWRDRQSGEIDTVAILTCPSHGTATPLHDRMPVVLAPEHFAAWLDVKETSPEEAAALLQPAPDDLFKAIEMHPKINDSKRDEPGIQEPLEPSLL